MIYQPKHISKKTPRSLGPAQSQPWPLLLMCASKEDYSQSYLLPNPCHFIYLFIFWIVLPTHAAKEFHLKLELKEGKHLFVGWSLLLSLTQSHLAWTCKGLTDRSQFCGWCSMENNAALILCGSH